MGKITEDVDIQSKLSQDCRDILGPEGLFKQQMPGFIVRDAQLDLALAIVSVILEKKILVAEAGTGTGKTYAYLTPAILSGKKTLITTATKTLQDQLVNKDIPILNKILGKAIYVQNLKGRANYICRYRTNLHIQEGQFVSPEVAHDILTVYEKMASLNTGERGELPDINEDSKAWGYVTSTVDNCLNKECPEIKNCYLIKARKKALEADVVVINHHLYFADSRLKEDGFGELLPAFDIVIFDEAHKIFDVASHFYSQNFSTRQLRYLMDDILKHWPILDLANQPLKEYSLVLDKIISAFLLLSANWLDKVEWQKVQYLKEFNNILDELQDFVQKLLLILAQAEIRDNAGLTRCQERLLQMEAFISNFNMENKDAIRWIETFKHAVVLNSTPITISTQVKELLKSVKASYIFTSATLTVNSSFSAFLSPLGIDSPVLLKLSSPFNYCKQAILYLPRGMPDTRSIKYYDSLLERVLPIIQACGGRCFFLFTSHKALNLVAKLLAYRTSYPLLVQGEESKSILLAKFRELNNAILLGCSTFWEGIDVKGEALSCVIIDKLPFSSITDPVMRGRISHLEKNGGSGFDEISLPSTVLALKQGIGRLIRDIQDKGVLVIADPRLSGRNYGKVIFASLPNMRKTREEQKVLDFIQNMAVNYEVISD